MFDWIDRLYLDAKLRMKAFAEDMRNSEAGVSDMVVIVILIVVALALAAVFQEQLRKAIETVGEKLMEFIEGGEGD